MLHTITYEIVTVAYKFQAGFIASARNVQGVDSRKIRSLEAITADGATVEEAKANLRTKMDKALA